MSSSIPMKTSFSPWLIRWVVGGIMLAGLAWMIFFSQEAAPHPSSHSNSNSKQNSLRSTSSPVSSNGTELLVRAFTIADRTANNPSQRTFSGTLQARYQSLLGFRVAGKIVERHVETGDRVRKGQVLFRLDPTDFDLQIQVAESDLQAARSQLIQIEAEEKRLADLRQTRSTSQSDYDLAVAARDTARARLRAAENRWMMAKNQRDYAQLEVDQDGLVTKIMAEVGQVVSPGQPVVQWVHGNEMEAAISVPESMQHMLDQRNATVRFWSRPDLVVQGVLREVSPVADPTSRTYDARFTLIDPPADLALGLTATVQIDQSHEEGISVPMGAIAQVESSPIVWRIRDDGSVESVNVQILKYGSQRAVIQGDLAPGEKIVSAGVQRIDAQCRVRIWQDLL